MCRGGKIMEKYVSEVIKEEYKEWKPGQVIFLSAHTGAGKTFFILNELLEFAAISGKRILYLVNRSILKEQIEEKINTEVRNKLRRNKNIKSENLAKIIEVKLYQTIESECKKNPDYKIQEEYDYIIADEAHYFLEDSMFNTYTQLSYDWIMGKRYDVVLIFISATIDRMKKYIWEENTVKENDNLVGSHIKLIRGNFDPDVDIKSYEMKADYSYVKVSLLKKIEEITELVEKDKSKWLIFVDNIEKGKTIEKSLKKEEIDVAFITAESKKDRELLGIVQKINTREKYEQRVLIATSVMDNGISIKDLDLRKLIIMAMTREQFIQMLGRKRVTSDMQKLEVYILLREKECFRKCLVECEKRQRFISEAEKYNFQMDISVVLEQILESNVFLQCVKNICYVDQRKVVFSKLAIAQYDYLYKYYKGMVERFEKEGGTAFLREQLEWLGRKEAEQEIKELTKTLFDQISKIIEEYKNRELNAEENKEMRERIKSYISQVIGCCADHESYPDEEIKSIMKELGKPSNERTLSNKNFNKIMEILNLNYQMTKPNRSSFLISDKNIEEEIDKDIKIAKNSLEE